MKTSTNTAAPAGIVGEQKAVELIAKAGFDAWDFSMFDMCRYDWQAQKLLPNDHPLAGTNYLAFARELKHIGEECGIVCNQSHAPFPTGCRAIRDYMQRAIECTAEAGGEICVIHPDNNATPEQNAEMYQELLPFARGCGVKIATENMWNWDNEKGHSCFAACATPESFVKHIDVVGDDFLVACLDIGHAEMKGSDTSAVELIHALGHRLQALHIHDNDKLHDSHQIPFSMLIDFPPIVKALKEIGYSGYLTLEADHYIFDRAPEAVYGGLQDLAASVNRLKYMFDEA